MGKHKNSIMLLYVSGNYTIGGFLTGKFVYFIILRGNYIAQMKEIANFTTVDKLQF